MISITVDEFLSYIERNGYPQDPSALFADDVENVSWTYEGAACAYGQGLLNLWHDKFDGFSLDMVISKFYQGSSPRIEPAVPCPFLKKYEDNEEEESCDVNYTNFYTLITHQNDEHGRSLQEIVDFARANMTPEYLDSVLGEL